MSEQLLIEASRLLRQAQFVVALTGAGISTPSGIPDFRSPASGLWNRVNPFEVASLQSFRYRPEAFYEWIRPLAKTILTSNPNPAHIALARLEDLGILKSIITQNIDLLHTKAGSKIVYEVHGHIREATCISCFRVFPAEQILEQFLESKTNSVPRCAECNGVLKPNVVLYGEQLPAQIFTEAERDVRRADLMLIVGSSLEIYPTADLPRRILHKNGKLILINLGETEYDHKADIVIRGDVAEVLPRIVNLLEGER